MSAQQRSDRAPVEREPLWREWPRRANWNVGRLARAPGSFYLRSHDREFCGAFPQTTSRQWDPSHTTVMAAPSGWPRRRGSDVPRWVGVLPYEAMRGRERRGGLALDRRAPTQWVTPEWRKYPAVAEIRPESVRVVGDDAAALERLEAWLFQEPTLDAPAPELAWDRSPEPAHLHRQRIGRALDAIARGDMYQVNLARCFDFRAKGSPFSLFSALESSGAAPFGAVMDFGDRALVSLSPELFLDVHPEGRVITRPIKGTRPRLDGARGELLQIELERSEKEQAELTMIIDLERNDLGRLAEPGSVVLARPPQVVAYPTVLHREAQVEAQLPVGCSYRALLDTMCPSGSVTGAPKVSAMDFIAAWEAERRGLYTGALGFIERSGRMRLSMAIRTLTLEHGEARYFSGGGIVADSDPEQEVQETLWKAEQLSRLVELGRALD